MIAKKMRSYLSEILAFKLIRNSNISKEEKLLLLMKMHYLNKTYSLRKQNISQKFDRDITHQILFSSQKFV